MWQPNSHMVLKSRSIHWQNFRKLLLYILKHIHILWPNNSIHCYIFYKTAYVFIPKDIYKNSRTSIFYESPKMKTIRSRMDKYVVRSLHNWRNYEQKVSITMHSRMLGFAKHHFEPEKFWHNIVHVVWLHLYKHKKTNDFRSWVYEQWRSEGMETMLGIWNYLILGSDVSYMRLGSLCDIQYTIHFLFVHFFVCMSY